jgi:hypothetical protein
VLKAAARLPFPDSLPPRGSSCPGAPYPSPSLLRGRVPLPGVRFRCPSPEFAENSLCRRCSATPTVPRHHGEPHHPSPCATHAPWSPLACAGHLLPPRRPASRCRGDRALRGRRVPRSQSAMPASGPRARPEAEAACRAKRTASLQGRGLQAASPKRVKP